MNELEELRTAQFLNRANPDIVYQWYESLPRQVDAFDAFKRNRIPVEFEQQLLDRKSEVIDLALASWGANSETTAALYLRWCAPAVTKDWPPQPNTFPYAVLASLLSNTNAPIAPWWTNSIPVEDFEILIAQSDLWGLFEYLHTNPALGIGLLRACANKEGAYARIDEDRWLNALARLGRNKALHRINDDDYDGPDLAHYDIHKLIVLAAKNCPKTSSGAYVLAEFLKSLPTSASKSSGVNEDELATSIAAWDLDVPYDDEQNPFFSLRDLYKEDGMAPGERIQFHLLRHYKLYLYLSPEDSNRTNRLAAYAKNVVNGGQGWGNGYQGQLEKYQGHGLDIEQYGAYALKDGAAFMYATSFNEHIWSADEAAKPLRGIGGPNHFEYPESQMEIFTNRKAIALKIQIDREAELATESLITNNMIANSISAAAESVLEATKTSETVSFREFAALKKLVVWGFALLTLLILLR
jgi:hypothetical protein